MAFPFLLAGSSECDALIDDDIVSNLAGLSNNNAHAVINEQSLADTGAGMDFYTRHEPAELRDDSRCCIPASPVQPVRNPVRPDRMQPRIGEEHLKPAACGRVIIQHRLDIRTNMLPHRGSPSMLLRLRYIRPNEEVPPHYAFSLFMRH
ncbi:hypothetical protein D3C73_1192270 [compost metagenome]